LTDADKETSRRKSAVRSKVEHPFLTKRLWKGALPWPGEECQPSLCHAGDVEHQQMGTAFDGTGTPGMNKMREISPLPVPRRALYPMKTLFESRFRLTLIPSLHFATACSALPY
jgi:hypothetical protein